MVVEPHELTQLLRVPSGVWIVPMGIAAHRLQAHAHCPNSDHFG